MFSRPAQLCVPAALCAALLLATPARADDPNGARTWQDIVQTLVSSDKSVGVYAGAELPGSQRVNLPAIQFEFDSAMLTGAAKEQLDDLAQALRHETLETSHFAIHGHTDSAGAAAYNRELSERRAHAVSSHLQEKGVNAFRLVEVGFGETHLLHGVPAGDRRNRRVEIVRIDAASETPVPASNDRALIIGIGDYPQVSKLDGTVRDAIGMRDFALSHMGFDRDEVTLLIDENATRDSILQTAEEVLVNQTREGDTVLLYFSGHGFQQLDQNGDENDRLDETLIPYDAKLVDDTPQGMISDDEIAGLLSRLTGRRILFVVDACHAGTTDKLTAVVSDDKWSGVKSPRTQDGSPLKPGVPGAARPGADRSEGGLVATKDLGGDILDLTVWTAVRADQKALMLRPQEREPDGAGSVFTRYLLNGFRDNAADRNGDGDISRDELHSFVTAGSAAYCEKNRDQCENGLTPQLYASRGASIAFRSVGGPPTTEPAGTKDLVVRQVEAIAAASKTGVTLEVEPGTSLALDSPVQFSVTSEQDGFLTLLDISPDGNIVQLYPNRFTEQDQNPGRIVAGGSIRLPGNDERYHFRAAPPLGSGVIFALVTDERSDALGSLTSRHKDLQPVAKPRAYLSELIEALRAMDKTGRRTAKLRYTVADRSD